MKKPHSIMNTLHKSVYHACIFFNVGSGGQVSNTQLDSQNELSEPVWNYLKHWANKGGELFFHGQGDQCEPGNMRLGFRLREIFAKRSWSFSEYARENHNSLCGANAAVQVKLQQWNENHEGQDTRRYGKRGMLLRYGAQELTERCAPYYTNACLLSGVARTDKVYASSDGGSFSAIAYSSFGFGKISFFGDMNILDETVESIVRLAE